MKIKRTLADLDALLGIQEEKKEEKPEPGPDDKDWQGPVVSVNPNLLKKMAEADAGRFAAKEGATKSDKELEGAVTEQMKKILAKARELAEEKDGEASKNPMKAQELRKDFDSLLTSIFEETSGLSKDDLKKLKEAAFGPQTFWVTETLPLSESERTGVTIRGNLRKDRDTVFAAVCDKTKELFGDKFVVMMLEDPPLPDEEGTSGLSAAEEKFGPRVAFQIVPAIQATPPAASGGQVVLAAVLAALLFASCFNVALVANIAKLPKETLDYFASDAALNSDALPPGLDAWDPSAYLASALPLFNGLVASSFSHEAGHRIAAALKGVKLGPSYFIPNLQIGAFGAITPFGSLLKKNAELWDVAAAGPLAGGLASLALVAVGLAQSDPASADAASLVPIPAQLLQGSLLMGTVTKLALGDAAFKGGNVLLSPLAIAGWCGLVTTALNLLPVGRLDGGRMVQAAYGRNALALSSFFTYLGLGLGLLGSSLSLPFGLYVLIVQREAEKYVQDSVTPAGGERQTVTAAALLAAVLILLPMAPELAQSVGVSSPSDMFL